MVRIANAPCSWGVIEGIDGDREGWVRVVDEMAEAGYIGTELGDWGFMPTDPDVLTARAPRARPRAGRLVGQRLAPRPGLPPGVGRLRGAHREAAGPRRRPRGARRPGQRPLRRPAPDEDRGARPPRGRDDRGPVAGVRRGREPRREAGVRRGRDPDRRPPAHRHLDRDRGRGAAPVRHDGSVRPGPVPRHRALDLRGRRRPGGRDPRVPRPGVARPLQGLRPGGRRGLARQRVGRAGVRGPRRVLRAGQGLRRLPGHAPGARATSTTGAGSSWSRTSCPGWATRARARCATGSTCASSASDAGRGTRRRA